MSLWCLRRTTLISCGVATSKQSVGPVHLEDGGRLILKTVRCSSSWLTDMVDLAQMSDGIGLGVWGAIDTFETLASNSRVAHSSPRFG